MATRTIRFCVSFEAEMEIADTDADFHRDADDVLDSMILAQLCGLDRTLSVSVYAEEFEVLSDHDDA